MIDLLTASKPEPEELSARIQYVYAAAEKQFTEKGLRADGSELEGDGAWEDVEDGKDA